MTDYSKIINLLSVEQERCRRAHVKFDPMGFLAKMQTHAELEVFVNKKRELRIMRDLDGAPCDTLPHTEGHEKRVGLWKRFWKGLGL